jgi:hypothetical protein
MEERMMWWLLLACTQGRAPLTFVAELEAADCGEVDALTLPLEHLWLQQPALASVRPSAVGLAHAHPGHDPAGDVTGEILGPWVLEPCVHTTSLGTGRGYRGDVGSGQLLLLGTAVLHAEVDGLPVRLEAELDDPVSGVALQAELTDGATARLAFDPWLTLSVLPTVDTDGDGQLTTADEGALASFRYGLTNPNSWTLTLETP